MEIFVDKVISFCFGLIGVYVGWKLSWKTIVKQLSTDRLQKKFNALIEIKSVLDNIPPNLNKDELREKLKNDSEFCKSLTGRLVRLFGLRNELIPYLDSEFVALIDSDFQKLYDIGIGHYNFKNEKIGEFVNFTEKIISLTHSLENKLRQKQEKQLK